MKSLSVLLSVLVTLLGCNGLLAFQAGGGPARSWVSRSERISGISVVSGLRMTATARTSPEEKKPGHFLLEEFRTHSGEVLDPYDILKVSRDAERSEVRKAYLALSKRYHPDSVRNKSILPGKCNNLDDVREEWEKVKLSYEILKDKKTRRRYDRHAMIADPQGAMSRAAMDAVGKGLTGLGKGIFNVGAFAVQQMTKGKDEKKP